MKTFGTIINWIGLIIITIGLFTGMSQIGILNLWVITLLGSQMALTARIVDLEKGKVTNGY